MSSFTFPRAQHLKSPQKIAALFSMGNSTVNFPIRFQYIASAQTAEQGNEHMKIAFTVPKRRFKKAVDRNRIKRQMIEVFRLNKGTLETKLKEENKCLDLMIIYLGSQMPDYVYIEKKLIKALEKLCTKL